MNVNIFFILFLFWSLDQCHISMFLFRFSLKVKTLCIIFNGEIILLKFEWVFLLPLENLCSLYSSFRLFFLLSSSVRYKFIETDVSAQTKKKKTITRKNLDEKLQMTHKDCEIYVILKIDFHTKMRVKTTKKMLQFFLSCVLVYSF